MSIQITVRLPDDLVGFIDAEVVSGVFTSRADAVARALVRERRHRTGLADVAILRAGAQHDDLDALAAHTAAHPIDLGD
jgi:Arc/MetJ-type ribon-helix-helix transcriptional regulator